MLSCFVFNSLPFEISDPTFVYPEPLLRGAAPGACPVWLTPFFSHSSKLPVSQLLSFDNHLNCPGGGVPIPPAPRRSATLICALAALFCRARQLICRLFCRLRTLYKNTGVYPLRQSVWPFSTGFSAILRCSATIFSSFPLRRTLS